MGAKVERSDMVSYMCYIATGNKYSTKLFSKLKYTCFRCGSKGYYRYYGIPESKFIKGFSTDCIVNICIYEHFKI